jgi:large subunit ribosomal protein L10
VNKEEKAAVIDRVADQIQEASAIFAIDYRGISVKQVQELRAQLGDADARFQIVKNRLTIRAADKAGAEELKGLLEGPTAFAFVRGDAALAAKALATFRRQNGVLAFKGGTMEGEALTIDQIESIARLPALDALHGQFVGVLASPLTTLVRGLGSLLGGLAIQLQQIQEQKAAEAPEEPAAEEPAAEEAAADEPAAEEPAAEEPAAEAPAAEEPAVEEAAADETAAEEPAAEETAAEEPAAEEAEAPAEEAAQAEPVEAEAAEAESEGESQQEEQHEETSEAPSEGEDQKPEEG